MSCYRYDSHNNNRSQSDTFYRSAIEFINERMSLCQARALANCRHYFLPKLGLRYIYMYMCISAYSIIKRHKWISTLNDVKLYIWIISSANLDRSAVITAALVSIKSVTNFQSIQLKAWGLQIALHTVQCVHKYHKIITIQSSFYLLRLTPTMQPSVTWTTHT